LPGDTYSVNFMELRNCIKVNSTEATKTRGGYSYIRSSKSSDKWHLRFGVTPNCNFKCTYCAPDGGFPNNSELPYDEVTGILEASYKSGIQRVHWTGGEPTYRKDIIKCIGAAKRIGFSEQVITTNGYRLSKILNSLIENGMTRVIVSLDTLSVSRFHDVTGLNILDRVLYGMELSVKRMKSPTKMSCCTMRSTLGELQKFIDYAHDINSRTDNLGSLIIKLNQFFPSNPAQLSEKGKAYWEREVVTEDEILEALDCVGGLNKIERPDVIGDNPSYNYYKVGDSNVIVGVLAMYTWKYRCGGCHKLRVKPNGEISICMDYPDADVLLAGKPSDEKERLIAKAIYFREVDLEELKPIDQRTHFNPQLGSQRFGKIGSKKEMSEFYPIITGIETC